MSKAILPANINFTLLSGNSILKGADWKVEVSLADRIDSVDYPVDLTDFVGYCHIREDANAEIAVARPTVDIFDPEQGSLSISLTEVETASIPTRGNTYKECSRYQYDVVIINPITDESFRILHGYVDVSPQITKEVF